MMTLQFMDLTQTLNDCAWVPVTSPRIRVNRIIDCKDSCLYKFWGRVLPVNDIIPMIVHILAEYHEDEVYGATRDNKSITIPDGVPFIDHFLGSGIHSLALGFGAWYTNLVLEARLSFGTMETDANSER